MRVMFVQARKAWYLQHIFTRTLSPYRHSFLVFYTLIVVHVFSPTSSLSFNICFTRIAILYHCGQQISQKTIILVNAVVFIAKNYQHSNSKRCLDHWRTVMVG